MKKIFCAVILSLMAGASWAADSKTASAEIINVAVTEDGFVPSSLKVPAGKDITLRVTRKTDSTCARQVQVPSKKIKVSLPLNQPVDVKLGKLEKSEIKFGCGMNMMVGGMILAE